MRLLWAALMLLGINLGTWTVVTPGSQWLVSMVAALMFYAGLDGAVRVIIDEKDRR